MFDWSVCGHSALMPSVLRMIPGYSMLLLKKSRTSPCQPCAFKVPVLATALYLCLLKFWE